MKEIRAVVRPGHVPPLREALRAIPGFPGLTLYRAEGFTAPAAVDRRSVRDELIDFTVKTMLCVVADDAMAAAVRDAVFASCRTGQVGDGPVWVVDTGDIRRTRDGAPP